MNVNNLLGGPGEPAATSADFVGLSSTIGAHELGHLSGLEHGDSYGPIGSGIYAGVNPELYSPAYPGPSDAGETIDHIMASGASVGATLEDAINDPFFGEREAIKLSFGENGTPTNEETSPHYAMANAQSISLQPLVVPDTDLEGVDADQTFNVTAADVVGDFGLNSNGQSNTDYYSFTAQAGTLINLQVMSAVLLDRPQGAFDTTLTVYDSHGNVIAYNDDSFQDTDSTIIDLTLPTTGTYYVEVTASSKTGEPTDQTGAYELFMYTFALESDPSAGDSLYAGSGDDTIIAGSADDTIAAQPQDVLSYGSGAVTSLQTTPYIDVSAGPNQAVDEGTSVTLTGSFIDPDDADTHTYSWQVVSPCGQQVAEGNGLCFTFTPENVGCYTVTFTVMDQNGGSGSASVEIKSIDVPPVLTVPTSEQTVSTGVSQSISLGELAVTGIGPFTDTVTWGDGQTSTFKTSAGGALSLAHTYENAGCYTICETVSECGGGSTKGSFSIDAVTAAPTTTTLGSSSASSVYGHLLTFTAAVLGNGTPTGTVAFYAGSSEIGAGSLSLVNGSDVATFSTSALSVGASPYMITAVYDGDVRDGGSNSQLVSQTITPASLDITADNETKTYGTLETLNATAFTETGLVTANGDTITGITETSIGAPVSAPIGSDPIIASGAAGSGLSNYTITYAKGSLTVSPAALVITANNKTKTYGALETFGATAFTETGLVTANGDTVTGVTETSTGAPVSAPVGSDPIIASGATGSGLSNYTITYANGSLTVSPATLVITANNGTKTYGTVETFGATAFTETGLVTANGDTITGVTETSTGVARFGNGGLRSHHRQRCHRQRPEQLHHHLRKRLADGQPRGVGHHSE